MRISLCQSIYAILDEHDDSHIYALAIEGKKLLSFQLCYLSFTIGPLTNCLSKEFLKKEEILRWTMK